MRPLLREIADSVAFLLIFAAVIWSTGAALVWALLVIWERYIR